MATMDYQLTLHGILERSRQYSGHKEIVSRMPGNVIKRQTYAQTYERICRLANALQKLGVQRGDRVATFAFNHHRHHEIYFAVPCMGAVYHTLNIRLSPQHLIYVINHAEDKVIFIDDVLLPAIEAISGHEQLKTVKAFVVMTERPDLPETKLENVYHYEQLLAEAPASIQWPEDISEWDPAGMCYTSATTGNPKGVTYTHRALWLHSLAICSADVLGVRESDVILSIVPMFHANAWGLPFAGTWVGAKLVYPGPLNIPAVFPDLLSLMEKERVTLTGAVPTVMMALLQAMEKIPTDLSALERVVCGGSAVPLFLIQAYEKKFNVNMVQGYGMTEAAPVTHVSTLTSWLEEKSDAERYAKRGKAGRLLAGLEMKIIGQDGREVPWDGKTPGEVVLRGPWIADEYYKDERTKDTFKNGWYYTGDIATVDEDGYIAIVDRTKDVVKSGGEWISTVDLENAIMSHPKVQEAAVIGIAHPKWDERPLACVVAKADFKGQVTKEEILEHIAPRFARWQLPDDVVFIDEIPKTSTLKFDKKVLRERFKGHYS